MRIEPLAIPAVKRLWPDRFEDPRGFLSETWSRASLAKAGLDIEFVQENHTRCTSAGAVRGLHFQAPPMAQHKLVRVVAGRIFDVVVDLRKASPTYGEWVAAEISATDWSQILAPAGFAHGFCALEPNTEVVYLLSAPYSPAHERAIAWDDPDLAVAWPAEALAAASLSDRDRRAPPFAALDSPF